MDEMTEAELAEWLKEQVQAYMKGTLSQDKIDKLDEMGFFKDGIYKSYINTSRKSGGYIDH